MSLSTILSSIEILEGEMYIIVWLETFISVYTNAKNVVYGYVDCITSILHLNSQLKHKNYKNIRISEIMWISISYSAL